MKTLSGKQFCKILESHGWKAARITGSHHIYTREDSNFRITVPVHANKDLKAGLQRALMKAAGIREDEL
ncbi:MAG: type II toxin-antitoxin system HicA family toxin [Phycisphaerae bacterium]|nr:type II toxin-antitoxin system HicA family toxin [Phycisphaerae bacterium]